MMKLFKVIITALCLITGANTAFAATYISITSPDKQLIVKVYIAPDGRLTYTVTSKNVQLLAPSPLGITIDDIDLGSGAKLRWAPIITKINDSYTLPGNHSVATSKANEASIPVETSGKIFKLIVRVYNDGIGIRYVLPAGSKKINGETTTWNLPAKTSKVAWSGYDASYEALSKVTGLDDVPQDSTLMGPITMQVAGHYLSISEADCENFSDMCFMRNGNAFKAYFPFAKKGWDIKERADNRPEFLNGTYNGEKVSPWRTTIIANNLTGLINSDLLMNLCPPPAKGQDFSWVAPGRCMWQWWSVGSPVYEDQKNWYDAAAKLKWEYYLVDDGWRTWSTPGKDQWALLGEVIAYGKSVGVKSIVWVDSKEMREGEKRRVYLEKIKALGATGIKIDFIPQATTDIMQWYMGALQDCAELKLMVNFHGSVKPTGLRRTYPNDITREAVRGNEWHMTRYKRVEPFEQDVSLPFTRLMAGAADITPVMLDPEQLTSTKFTWAHEFAQAIVYLSPITHFSDQYKFYLESPMFDLFQQVPTVWDETRVLPVTKMGEVVAYARRKGTTWWVGVMNGDTEQEIKIPLSFLKKSVKATLIYDDKDINTAINRKEQTLGPNSTLTIKLAPGGGFVGRF
ncbi:glycoside hydrolase family 97 catalytic domain-containing protein [Mucilaginibacter sp. UYCu711]|uniref:glycoside hydrolase family 97 protein n=1 Tax=Mucilaginibacter sp. UYCu711 TaxID=3156339 RepID=UPI003D1E90CA